MFDVDETAKAITDLHSKRRKRKFQSSKLDAHTHCILALHRAGLSLSQLQLYLEQVNVKAARSTIHYWLKKHGEIRFG
jgi:transposase-like protein